MRNVNYIDNSTELENMVGSYIEEKDVLSVYNCVFGNDIAATIKLFYDSDVKDIYVQNKFNINTTRYITGLEYTIEIILYKSTSATTEEIEGVFRQINRIFFNNTGEYCEVAHE